MSSEPVAAVAPATQPISSVEEKKLDTPAAAFPPPAAASDTKAAEDSKQAEAPAVEESKPASQEPTAPAEDSKLSTPQAKLASELPSIVEEAGTNEIWGVILKDATDIPTTIVLEKFLRANTQDVPKAKAQLIKALKWRKEIQPRKLLDEVEFNQAKFGGLGFVTVYPETEGRKKEIVTWNIYGAVKDNNATFGNVEEFIQWRSALMELSVRELDLPSATVPIPENGEDQYRMLQVHDYLDVAFLRMDPAVRAASKETISTFSMAYPELLREKFFVNVPLVMGWVFGAMKLFLSAATVRKFHPLSYGSSLAGEVKGFGELLPKAYGGKGGDVKDGLTVKYAAAKEAAAENVGK